MSDLPARARLCGMGFLKFSKKEVLQGRFVLQRRYSPLAIKLVAFGKPALIQSIKLVEGHEWPQ